MLQDGPWISVKDGDDRARALFNRHYSRRHYRDNRHPLKFVGPGEYMVLLTENYDALFVWRLMNRPDLAGQEGVCCSIFRNESELLASWLIQEAELLARRRWPELRFYTYVDPAKIQRSRTPGRCFHKAGWQVCGETKGGQLIFEKLPPV